MDLNFIDQDKIYSDWEKSSGSKSASLNVLVLKIINELVTAPAVTIPDQIPDNDIESVIESLYLLREIFLLNFPSELQTHERICFHRKLDSAIFDLMKRSQRKSTYEEFEHYKSQVLDHLPTGFFSVAPDWTITYANPSSESALAGKASEVIGKNVWELHPALIDSEFYHAYHRTMEHRTTEEVINFYPQQDKWYHVVSYPLDKGIAVSFADITQRKKAEIERALLNQKLQMLFEAMPQKVWITDAIGNATYFNSETLEYTGKKLEELLGSSWICIIHPDDHMTTGNAWNTAVESGMGYEVDYRILAKDGTYRWHVARGIPIHDSIGNITEWIGTSTDIHDQKLTQEKLKDAVVAREEFLSIASHELKTPLTSMKLQTILMKKNLIKGFDKAETPEKLIQLLQSSEKSIDKLNRLVEDVLDVSRISSGKLDLILGNVNLSELVHETVLKMKPIFGKVELTTSLPDQPVIGIWDAFRLEQVLINLLTNAHRYGDGSTVLVTLSNNDKVATVSVKDQGVGIREEDMVKIFNRFERGLNPNQVGMGLGLYITKQIIDLHKGEIEVKSQLGKGSEFRIFLPFNA